MRVLPVGVEHLEIDQAVETREGSAITTKLCGDLDLSTFGRDHGHGARRDNLEVPVAVLSSPSATARGAGRRWP
jgi:hypothetical protein